CLFQECLYLDCDSTYIGPANSWNWIKINPQLVWMFQIASANRMRVEFNAAEVNDPCQARRIINHYFFRGSAQGKRQGDGSQPRRTLLRRTFLVKSRLLRSIYKSLQNDRTIPNSGQSAGSDREVILHKVELGEPHLLREVRLVRVGDRNFPSFDPNYFAGFLLGHGPRLPFKGKQSSSNGLTRMGSP